ncbi:MAG: LysR family transcriptional regulator [Alphaproteobacteria bacterium]|nr:LysR family transcriptional regulator [Alphaproteobacteria bacterium]
MAFQRSMIPPLNGLRAFEAVARHLNFTRAAEELGVTQSAVSHQIRNLEDIVGVALFQRAGGHLTLTQAGEALLPGISEAFVAIQRAIGSLEAAREGRPLGLITRAHFALKWLAPRLVRLWERYPGFDLRLQHSNFPADFSRSDIDLSIEWRRKDDVDHRARSLVEGNLTPACSPAVLREHEQPLAPSDLKDFALLHEADETAWREWLVLAGVGNLTANRNHYYDDTNVRQEAAIAGEGFSLVCPELVESDVQDGRLLCPFDLHLPSYAYFLVTPDHPVSLQARRFIAWLLEEAGCP